MTFFSRSQLSFGIYEIFFKINFVRSFRSASAKRNLESKRFINSENLSQIDSFELWFAFASTSFSGAA